MSYEKKKKRIIGICKKRGKNYLIFKSISHRNIIFLLRNIRHSHMAPEFFINLRRI